MPITTHVALQTDYMEKEGTVLSLRKKKMNPERTPQMDKLGNLLGLYQSFCATYRLRFPSIKAGTQQLERRWGKS